MKCPTCETEGKKSTLRMAGGGTVTGMFTRSFYDENGRYHFHDPNRMAEQGRCSNGHRVLLVHGNKCDVDGCDFGSDAAMKILEAATC